MNFTEDEKDALLSYLAGTLARERKTKELLLNYQEAVSYITMIIKEQIREGKNSVSEILNGATGILGINNVMPGVPEMIKKITIVATFTDGAKVIIIENPIQFYLPEPEPTWG